jgi:O-antigen ligase
MLSGGCVLLTGSRSSFLGLLVWCFYAVLVSKQRWKVLLPLILAAPLVWTVLPPSLQTRFETIIDPSVGPANAKESGDSRLEGLLTGLELFGKNPLSGIGPGVWRVATGRLLESHNLYGQLLGEMGGLGGVTFLLILTGFWINVRWQRKNNPNSARDGPCFCYEMAMAIGVSVLLMLFEGNFGHNLFRFNWLWYGGFLIIARHCVVQRAEAVEEETVEGVYALPAVAGA